MVTPKKYKDLKRKTKPQAPIDNKNYLEFNQSLTNPKQSTRSQKRLVRKLLMNLRS